MIEKGHFIILFLPTYEGILLNFWKGDLIANVKRGKSGLASFPDSNREKINRTLQNKIEQTLKTVIKHYQGGEEVQKSGF